MEKKIRILPQGPYEVSGEVPLRVVSIGIDTEGTSESWEQGREFPAQPQPYHLCRCGHSAHKPHCDGTHRETGFEGEESASKTPSAQNAKRYEGAALDLLDDESLCASLRFCDRGVGVWEAVQDSADPGNRELAIQEACACAAGRLTVLEKDGTPIEPELEVEVGLVQDTAARWRGPLRVQGGLLLEGADGEPYERRNRMTLCRCGESENMPFCDTSHLSCPHMEGFDE